MSNQTFELSRSNTNFFKFSNLIDGQCRWINKRKVLVGENNGKWQIFRDCPIFKYQGKEKIWEIFRKKYFVYLFSYVGTAPHHKNKILVSGCMDLKTTIFKVNLMVPWCLPMKPYNTACIIHTGNMTKARLRLRMKLMLKKLSLYLELTVNGWSPNYENQNWRLVHNVFPRAQLVKNQL